MKKQHKKTGFDKFCDILEKSELTFQEYQELVKINEGGLIATSDKANQWLTGNRTASEGLKELIKAVNDLFKPTKDIITIPADWVVAINEAFPAIKGGSGKYLRCNAKEVESALIWFKKNYPDYVWYTIMGATLLYVNEQEKDNYKWTRRVKYFIRKQLQDKSFESDLAEYCRVFENPEEHPSSENHYQEKVV